MLPENMEGKQDEVVVVQAEALLLLIEVAIEDDVLWLDGVQVLLLQAVQGHGEHIEVVVRIFEELAYLNHVPGLAEGHLPQGQAALLIDNLQHGVDVRVVQHQEALGILDDGAVFLKDRDAEAVEGVDVAGVVVPGQGMDALAHLVGCLVGEGDAQDVARQDAQLVHQVGEAVGQRPGLAGARPGDDPDEARCGGNSLPLGGIQALQDVCHVEPPLFDVCSIIPVPNSKVYAHNCHRLTLHLKAVENCILGVICIIDIYTEGRLRQHDPELQECNMTSEMYCVIPLYSWNIERIMV